MNDDELITAVRESFTDVHSTTPAAQIVKRGRTVRARRRVPGVAAAGAAAAAAVAVSVALPASHPAASHPTAGHPIANHPASGPSVVHLAAWTVTRQADGSIKITFREAADAAGLQRTLRADGVPASVTFTGQQNPACQPYPASGRQAKPSPGNPYGGPLNGVVGGPLSTGFHSPAQSYTTPYALVIHPSALPSGAGLQIRTSGTPGPADNFLLNLMFVRASPQCTGS
jgi:hypothetical protein